MKRKLCGLMATWMAVFGLVAGVNISDGLGLTDVAFAASAGDVVINEIAWAGSIDNSNDEWVELYNSSSLSVDLAGWFVEDDYATQYVIPEGVIPAKGYFLIEDTEASVSNVAADTLVGLSFSNSGDSLVLKNETGVAIDTVNSSGGAWYAGDNVSKASMERVDPFSSADSAENWAAASMGNGSFGSAGSAILGTPGGQNSSYQGPASSTSISFDLSNENPLAGSSVTATAIVSNAADLSAYGFDVVYDPLVLEFVSVSEDGFLSSGTGSTAFNAALQNGEAGTLILGNAVLGGSSGVSGSGNLFTITFDVIGSEGNASDLVFGAGSFLADTSSDILANLNGSSIAIGSNTIGGIAGLVAAEGSNAYELALTWEAPAEGADSYIIERVMADGNFVQIGTSTTESFMDSDTLNFGGGLIPGVSYDYKVRAVKNGIQSASTEVSGTESRGLVGDNNRSGRVDGRDIEMLAKSYGAAYGDSSYESLADTTFDGVVDGSDLIDIGANFGLVY